MQITKLVLLLKTMGFQTILENNLPSFSGGGGGVVCNRTSEIM